MKFTIQRNLLLDTLNKVSHGLSSKTPMPVLTGVKIDATLNELVLTTSNREVSVQVKLNKNDNLEIENPGKCVVPGKYFIEIVKKISEDKINFVLFEETTIKITTEKTDFTLVALNEPDFPNINFERIGTPIQLSSRELKKTIRQTNFAAGTSEARVILTGVCFELDVNKLIVTATDSYRLAKKEIQLDQDYPRMKIVIPNKSLDELEKLLGDEDQPVNVYLISNKALVIYNDVAFITRLIEGNYPDTSGLFPKDELTRLIFKKQDLLSTVDRASLFTNLDSSNIIKLIIRANKSVQIASSNNEIGRVVEEVIPLNEPSVPNFQTAFSAKYFLEALKSFEGSTIEVQFTGEIKPFVITCSEDEGVVQLILPVRIF